MPDRPTKITFGELREMDVAAILSPGYHGQALRLARAKTDL
jgi:hypothetical protein